jgi:hypothetical protein
MKSKIAIFVAAVLLVVPALASAETTETHVSFSNLQPQYSYDISGVAASQRPFGVECSVVGFTKNSVTWAGSVMRASLQNAFGLEGITYDSRMQLPDLTPYTTFWVGTDVSTSTIPATMTAVKYVKTGLKTMWLGVTDGSMTELARCGTQYVDLDPPKPKQVLKKANGVELVY